MHPSIPWRLMIWDRERQQGPLRHFFRGMGYEIAPADSYPLRSWLPNGHDPSHVLLEIQTDGLDGMRFLELCDRAKAAWPIDWSIDFTSYVIVLSRKPSKCKPAPSDYQAVVAALQSAAHSVQNRPARMNRPVAAHA